MEKLEGLTIEEKISLLSGADCWNTRTVPEKKVPSVMFSDGPHGLRKQIGVTDNLGVGESAPAVCFPTASAIACSFDRELLWEVGHAIGEECVWENVSVILGPGVCQKRSPLCGRNFEYFSEDPVASGQLAAAWINGVQSTGTGTSLKHFAANNQEKKRMTINSVVDERTLRDIYLKAFQIAISNSDPATVMCSYNRINGVYSSENPYLLKKILRDEWGYKGIVVSDWGAVHDRTLGVKNGLNIEMPGNNGLNDRKVLQNYKAGNISEEEIDRIVSENIAFARKYGISSSEKNSNKIKADKYNSAFTENQENNSHNKNLEAHHDLAVKAAENSAVLLKNDDSILPVDKKDNILIIGEFAEKPRYQGAGSSKINPVKVDIPIEIFEKEKWNYTYCSDSDASKAVEESKTADKVIIFAGLPEGYESEGLDRKNMDIPESQNSLIEAVSAVNKNVIVVLIGGSPMELKWTDKVKGILLMYLGGEGMGTAVSAILSGEVNPSGKLAESWPVTVSDNPSYRNFSGGQKNVEYREGIFVGYRYYDTANVPVRFPFGYGLSYSKFEYSKVSTDKINYHFYTDGTDSEASNEILVSFKIKNTGTRAGSETAFVFSHTESENVFFPNKELRDFVKIKLLPGEEKAVECKINLADLGYYNTKTNKSYVRPGKYRIMVGSSVSDIKGSEDITIESTEQPEEDYRKTAPCYFELEKYSRDHTLDIPKEDFQKIYGRDIPPDEIKKPFTVDNTLEDARDTFVGKLIIKYATKLTREAGAKEPGQEDMIFAGIMEMPFYGLTASGGDMLPENVMLGIVDMLNGHYIRGIGKILKKHKTD